MVKNNLPVMTDKQLHDNLVRVWEERVHEQRLYRTVDKLHFAKFLEEIETELDQQNVEFDDAGMCYLCAFCNAKKYNGKKGVVHQDRCLILKIRNQIKEVKETCQTK